MIERIENLAANVQLDFFANGKTAGDRHIDVPRARSAQQITARVTEGPGCLALESCGIEPLAEGRIGKRRGSNDVGPVEAETGQRNVGAIDNGQRSTGDGGENGRKLPA